MLSCVLLLAELGVFLGVACRTNVFVDPVAGAAASMRRCLAGICLGAPRNQMRRRQPPSQLRVEVAGTICTGSENHVAFLAWIAHVRKSKPVLVIHECHKNFPSSILDNLQDDQCKLYHIVVDPKMIGHPVNRPDRMYTWCVRKDHVLRGSVEDYIEIFSASLVKNRDIFVCAPDGFKQEQLQRLAKNRMCTSFTSLALWGGCRIMRQGLLGT